MYTKRRVEEVLIAMGFEEAELRALRFPLAWAVLGGVLGAFVALLLLVHPVAAVLNDLVDVIGSLA